MSTPASELRFGLIGSGNMAGAIARGWGDPVLVSDTGSGRAQLLVDELGGEAFSSNVELAGRVDVLVLCHKPYHLEQVARELSEFDGAIVSVLGGTTHAQLQAAYPKLPVYATMPNTPVEVRQGVVVYGEPEPAASVVVNAEIEAAVERQFARLGRFVRVPERLLEAATTVTGVGPAYQALLAEAQIDAAVRQGLGAELAAQLVIAMIQGSAALIEARDYDTLAVRRGVTSPGGSTARGLNALEHAGVRAAFQDAADAVAGR